MQDMNEAESKDQRRGLQKGHILVLSVCGLVVFGPHLLPNLTTYELGWRPATICVQVVCVLGILRVAGSVWAREKKFAWWLYAPIVGLAPFWVRHLLVPFLIWGWSH